MRKINKKVIRGGASNLNKTPSKLSYLVLIVLFLLAILSTSYAVLSVKIIGERKYSLTIGTLDFKLDNEKNAIRLMNAYPMSDEEGQALTPYTFSLTNTGTLKEHYKISLVTDTKQQESCTGCEFLTPAKLRYSLNINGVAGTSKTLSEITTLDSGELAANQTKNYELRLWLRSEATIEEENKYYFGKIKVDISQEEYKEVGEIAFKPENLGANCKIYDDGVDTFLVGKCSNNYVWYSGKLWRVVLKNNETGAVKMVTDNPITSIAYNEVENSEFENSYMDQWLTQEFLPTLHDYEDYLVTDSIWDATENSSSTPTRPSYTTTVTRIVGLLNAYEYYTTYAQSGGIVTSSNGYLNTGVYWWLLTPYNTSGVWYVYVSNDFLGAYSQSGKWFGVRPTVNLKPIIQITSGTGSRSNPYILEGDIKQPVNGTTLLSTRYSGEYVTFNNELYRIVGVENGLTKITAVNVPSSLASIVFDSTTNNFANASIKTDLENYYQDLKTTSVADYNMIEPNTTWYLGTVVTGTNYKASICASIDATKSMNACTDRTTSTIVSIGLPRIGEMFTSQLNIGNKTHFWTLSPSSYSGVSGIFQDNYVHFTHPTGDADYSARPSMYLKRNVVIANDNTGNGTHVYPYSLSLN